MKDPKLEGLTSLGRVWLEELNLLHRIKDDATAPERRALIARANAAAREVEEAFRALCRAGKMRALSRSYKAYAAVQKADGKPVRPWWAYAESERRNMVRLLAREQKHRARFKVAP